MHIRVIRAIARKDALDLWLDKSKVGALVFPLLLAGLWLLISHLVAGKPTTLLVYNPGHSPLPQIVSSSFASTQMTEATSPAQVSAAFPTSDQASAAYDVGLVIPAGFEQHLRAGSQPQVNLYLNGKNLEVQQRATLQAIITNYARSVAAPHPPLSLVTQTVNAGPTPASTLTVGKLYSVMMLPLSLMVGLTLMPGLIIEEKEKKTLRWLLVSPASLSDILLGKALVTLIYQLVLSVVTVAILGGFAGNAPLALLYILLGASLVLALGMLFGVIFQTASAAGVVGGLAIMIFILPAVVIPLAPLFASNPITDWVKVLPTYYIADGANNAVQQVGTLGSNLLDVGAILVTTLVVFLLTIWILRRQASVTGTI